MSFHIGQKVFCVDDRPSMFIGRPNKLERGRIYTISQVGVFNKLDPQHQPCVFLYELKSNAPVWAHRFRPVHERKTSIEIFTRMLLPKKENA